MAIDLCSESSSATMSPRISFSYDLSQSDVIPIEQRIFRSNSSSNSNNIDFDFCVLESFEVESSSADELFFDGKILPIQIRKKLLPPPKPIPQFETPPPPPPPSQQPETKLTRSDSDEKQSSNSKSFWRFKRSSSLNCGSGYARTLCPLPLLNRSNSTGSASSNVKRSSSSSLSKDTHNPNNHRQYLQKNQQSSSSSNHQKPPLKKNYSSYGNGGVRINPVLNVPSANLFGLGTIFSNSKDKSKKKNDQLTFFG